MTIKIARGVLGRIRREPERIVIQVRGAEPEQGAAALERAAQEIANLDAGWESVPGLTPADRVTPADVSPVMPTAEGPFITVDGTDVPYELLRTIPDIVARHLTEAGVAEATVASPAAGGPITEFLYGNRGPRPSVILRLYPPPPQRWREFSRIPDRWLEEACSWVTAGSGPDGPVRAAVVSTGFTLAPADALPFLVQARRAHTPMVRLMTGEPGASVRMAGGYFLGFEPNLALAGGGPAATDAELVATAHALREVGRRLAPEIGYAFVDLEPVFRVGIAPGTEWRLLGGEATESLEELCDEFVFDGFWWQVLGPGHLARLGRVPPESRPLPGGRMELSVGEPDDWLLDVPAEWHKGPVTPLAPYRRDPSVQGEARHLLDGCLALEGDTRGMVRARHGLQEPKQ